jgi:uncharacterized membrane protein
MDKVTDSFGEFITQLAWLARSVVNWIIWAGAGKFIPASCTWCRPAWMIGLAMGVVLIFVYWKGPKTD